MRRQPLEHLLEVGPWIESVEPSRLDQAHRRRGPLTRTQASCEQAVAPERHGRALIPTVLRLDQIGTFQCAAGGEGIFRRLE